MVQKSGCREGGYGGEVGMWMRLLYCGYVCAGQRETPGASAPERHPYWTPKGGGLGTNSEVYDARVNPDQSSSGRRDD